MLIDLIIVEDTPDYREKLKEDLGDKPFITIRGMFNNAEDFIASLRILPCNVVLMDLGLPNMTGIEAIHKARKIKPELQFLVYTVFKDDKNVEEALGVGAVGYALKNTSPDELYKFLLAAVDGEHPVSREIASKNWELIQAQSKNMDVWLSLSSDQQRLFDLLKDGLSYDEIAEKLNRSTNTMRSRIKRLYEVLKVQNKIQAINKVYSKR